jgi:ABC-type transporter Mla MlaB component
MKKVARKKVASKASTRKAPPRKTAARMAPVIAAAQAATPEPVAAPPHVATPVAEAPATAAPEVLPVMIATTPQRAGLKLEPSCLLRDTADMQFQLIAAHFDDGDVLLDGSPVERIDTAGIQLLVAFFNRHQQQGKNVAWTAVSDELLRVSQRLGVTAHLNLPNPSAGASP